MGNDEKRLQARNVLATTKDFEVHNVRRMQFLWIRTEHSTGKNACVVSKPSAAGRQPSVLTPNVEKTRLLVQSGEPPIGEASEF